MRTHPTLVWATTARRVELRRTDPRSAALLPTVCRASRRRIGPKDLDCTTGDAKPFPGKHRSSLRPAVLWAPTIGAGRLAQIVGGSLNTIPEDGARMM